MSPRELRSGLYLTSKTLFCSPHVSLHFGIIFIVIGLIFLKKITSFSLDIVYCVLIIIIYAEIDPLNNMAHLRGILLTPKTPSIKNGAPASYVKPSYYPLPYQAVIAIENCDIHEVLSWDINVNTKGIKIKIEWSLEKDNNGTTDILPKAIYNSISSYNLCQPSWSSSFTTNKLSLKVEWKINQPNSTNNIQQVNPASPTHPHGYSPGSSFNSPPSRMDDSGYGSPITPNFNQSHFSSPATRLYFSPPRKYSPKHDVYRNIPDSPSTSRTNNSPSPVHQTPNKPTNLTTTPSKSPPDNPAPTKSPTTPVIKSTIPSVDPNTNPTITPNSNPIDEIPDPDPETQNPLPQPPPPSEPLTSNSLTVHDSSSSPIDPHKSRKKKKKNKKVNTSSTTQPEQDKQYVTMINADLKFVIHKDSTDDGIIPMPDSTNGIMANPYDDVFLPTPDDLHIDERGLIDPTIKAHFMNLSGRCRLCNNIVRSYDVDEHLLECVKLNDNDLKSFITKSSKNIKADEEDIKDQVFNYAQYELEEEYLNQVFCSIDSYKQFVSNVEQFLNSRAMTIFETCKIYGLQSRSNILVFKS